MSLLVNFYPAKVKRCSSIGYYIEYYAKDSSGNLKRQIIKLNRLRTKYKTVAEFKEQTASICITINSKLSGGWSPFLENNNSRYYTPLQSLFNSYLSEKEKTLRPATMRSYKSICTLLSQFIQTRCPNIQCGYFNRVLAVDFLESVSKSNVSNRTYNNYLKMARAFFTWLLEHCYIKENPFALIKSRKTDKKRRIIIPPESRKRIRDYFTGTNQVMLIVCELVFNSLIRPKEISELRISDLHLSEKFITIRSSVAKTHYERAAALSNETAMRIEEYLEHHNFKPSYYIIGSEWKPAKEPISLSAFKRSWDKMRKRIGLPMDMQLYSLRDTGINTLLRNGVDTLTVMQHADHHDLAITTRYADHFDPTLVQRINENTPDF